MTDEIIKKARARLVVIAEEKTVLERFIKTYETLSGTTFINMGAGNSNVQKQISEHKPGTKSARIADAARAEIMKVGRPLTGPQLSKLIDNMKPNDVSSRLTMSSHFISTHQGYWPSDVPLPAEYEWARK